MHYVICKVFLAPIIGFLHLWRMNRHEIFQHVSGLLAQAGRDDPKREARALLRLVAGIGAESLISEPDEQVAPDVVQAALQAAARLAQGEPLSRIVGGREFYGRSFVLNADTLDPRPDTEILVDVALEWVKARGAEAGPLGDTPLTMLDLGTGTGCIPVTLLAEWAGIAQAVAVDVAPGAVAAAQENALRNGVADRFQAVLSDWDRALAPDLAFDLITSNPPYIPTGDIPGLASEVTNHDPIRALDGGADGLRDHAAVLSVMKKRLKPGGLGLVEIGMGQLANFRRLVDMTGLDVGPVTMDYNGIPRVVGVCFPLCKKS